MIKRLVILLSLMIVAFTTHAATLLPNARQVFIDRNGAPLANGSVYFYTPNTTTPKNTWQDAGQTILNVNPVALDAAGSAIIYGNGQYRQQVYDISGNLIWDQVTQDVQGLLGVYWGGTSGGSGNAQTLTPSQPLTSYATPLTITFIAGFSNTAAMTINVSGLGAKNVFKITSAGPAALSGSEVIANNPYQLIYDGTEFVLVNLLPTTQNPSEPVNAQAGTTYTLLSTDLGKLVTFSNSTSVTIPQSGSSGSFTNGWFADVSNITSGGTVTLTPTTSKIDGLTTLSLTQNQGIRIVSDGSNYFTVRGRQGTGNSSTSTAAFTETAFTANGTFTTPTDSSTTTVYWYEIVGAGGGGGGANSALGQTNASGGGGAGATAIGTFTGVSPATSITVTVGAAGTAGIAGTTGGSGGNSAIGAPVSITANGGAGGVATLNTNGGNVGGLGGTTSGANQNIIGGDGGSSIAATDTTDGTYNGAGGNGGASSKGGGGRGGVLGATTTGPAAGRAFGAGGGGGVSGTGGASVGAAGAGGLVTVRRMTN